jgi:hypothetical protein
MMESTDFDVDDDDFEAANGYWITVDRCTEEELVFFNQKTCDLVEVYEYNLERGISYEKTGDMLYHDKR